jgi:hypothetical protein
VWSVCGVERGLLYLQTRPGVLAEGATSRLRREEAPPQGLCPIGDLYVAVKRRLCLMGIGLACVVGC